MTKHDYYVYVYFRPNGAPCYVGKGRGRRWLRHLRKSHNPHLAAIINKAGGDVPRSKILEGLSNEAASAAEVALIAAIGRRVNGGPLVNMTDGGDGASGRPSPVISEAGRKLLREARLRVVVSDETRQKNRERAIMNGSRPPSRKGLPSPNRGKIVSKEQRIKISASLIAFNKLK